MQRTFASQSTIFRNKKNQTQLLEESNVNSNAQMVQVNSDISENGLN